MSNSDDNVKSMRVLTLQVDVSNLSEDQVEDLKFILETQVIEHDYDQSVTLLASSVDDVEYEEESMLM